MYIAKLGKTVEECVFSVVSQFEIAITVSRMRTTLSHLGDLMPAIRQHGEVLVLCFNDRTGGYILRNAMKNRRFSAVVIYGWLAALMAGCSTDSTGRVSVPVVPDTLKVSPNETLSFAAKAKGVQIYECRAKTNDATVYEWVLKAPEADLFDALGKRIGRHYGGPTWEGIDGSKVVGELKGREPSTETNAIPWLLLVAKKHEGNGVFSRVSSIQRLETVGGKAPTGGRDRSKLGTEVRVPYTAVYYFYTSER